MFKKAIKMGAQNQLSGKDIGKSISLKKENLAEFPWHHKTQISCPNEQYINVSSYYISGDVGHFLWCGLKYLHE